MTSNVIITCAVTGGIHTPTMSPHLPITPTQIADAAIGAAEAGAAVVHLHARDPETGRPDYRPATFMQFLPVIKQSHYKKGAGVTHMVSGGGGATFKPFADQQGKSKHTAPDAVFDSPPLITAPSLSSRVVLPKPPTITLRCPFSVLSRPPMVTPLSMS